MCLICQNPSLLAGLPAAALALKVAASRLLPSSRPAGAEDDAWARAAAGRPPGESARRAAPTAGS